MKWGFPKGENLEVCISMEKKLPFENRNCPQKRPAKTITQYCKVMEKDGYSFGYSSMGVDAIEAQANRMSLNDRKVRRNRADDVARIRSLLLTIGFSLLSERGHEKAYCEGCGVAVDLDCERNEEQIIDEILYNHDQLSPNCHHPREKHNASKTPNRGTGIFGNHHQYDDDDDVVTDCAMYTPPSIKTKQQVPKPNQRSASGYNPSDALYPVLANRIKRMGTLSNHAKTMGFPIEEAAEAGFVYLPKQNSNTSEVVCYYCGVKVTLMRHDDAWIEHAQANPFCDFVKREKGQDFINMVVDIQDEDTVTTSEFIPKMSSSDRIPTSSAPQQSTNQVPNEQPSSFSQSQAPIRQQIRPLDKREIQARLDRDECQMIIKMGFPRELVGQVIGEQLMYNGDDFKSFMDMYKAVESAAEMFK